MKTYNIFKVGDIAFEGNKSKNFSFGRFVENDIGNGIISHVFDVFRPITNYDKKYWKYAIHYEPIMKNILRKSTSKSTMMTNLVAKDFLKQTLNVPTLNEQIKIGILISKLDQLIDANERKHSELNIVLKLFMDHLLNNTWKNINYTYPWEQKKLKDISEIIMGQSPASKFYSDKPNKFILVQGNADLKNGKVNPRIWTSNASKISQEKSILISVRAPVGEIAVTNEKVALGRGVAAINGNKYLFYSLKYLKNNKYWENLSTGSTFDSINSEILKNALIYLPNDDLEKDFIFKIINNLDNRIKLSTKYINSLKHLKRYLMKNMFI